MLFLLDIHQNILSAQALLKCNADFNSCVEIVVKPNNLCIAFNRDSSLCQFNVVMPDSFLKPYTVAPLCYRNSPNCTVSRQNNTVKLNFQITQSDLQSLDTKAAVEIIFRCQISSESVIKRYLMNSNFPAVDFKDMMQEKFKTIQIFKIICTGCGSLLTEKSIKFQSLRKYYEEKSELDETSFCHKHSNHGSDEITTDSLYIGDMHFYFHHSILNSFVLTNTNKVYKCFKCSSILSFQKKMDNLQYIGFFSDKIMLVKPETEVNDIEKYKINTCLFSFSSIIQELLKTTLTSKLYLQCKVEEKIDILLLWINSKVVQFLLHQENNEKVYDTEFKGNPVYKVLYCMCESDSELSRKWKHDFNVDFFQISDNMMNVITNLLQKSSEYFPENQETVKGFTFGYLPTDMPVF